MGVKKLEPSRKLDLQSLTSEKSKGKRKTEKDEYIDIYIDRERDSERKRERRVPGPLEMARFDRYRGLTFLVSFTPGARFKFFKSIILAV